MTDLTLHLDDLTFPEAPRWRDGCLVLSDFYAHEVIALAMDGSRTTLATVPGQPSGLGWRPDGALMVVATLNVISGVLIFFAPPPEKKQQTSAE